MLGGPQSPVKVPPEMRQITRPNSFIYTLMGDLVRYYGGEIWVGSLTRLMAEFRLSEQAVRQAVSRMSRQGWITARKVGNRSYYAMTERGVERVERVSRRIYLLPENSWDGKWRMLAYTIPERLRNGRDRLRKDLTLLGFAPLSSSLFISPRDSLDAARDAAQAHELTGYIDLFLSESRGPHGDRHIIERCWDLGAIAREYGEFILTYEQRLAELRANHLEDAQAFVEREWLVHDFRKFVYRDPGLPASLLAEDWPARRAGMLFREVYEVLKPQALRFFESVFELAPDREPLPRKRENPFDTLLVPGDRTPQGRNS